MRVVALILVVVACSSARIPSVRFANAPAVTVVDDRRDVRVKPAKRIDWRLLGVYDGSFHRRVTRALELPAARRALGVNALDEVPDSTWFTNRIGVRDLTPEEVRDGVASEGSPEPHKPWTVLSTKISGTAVGFIIRDSRGVKHLLKLEERGYPELETATDAIVSRLLWAAGYNVPEDHVVYVHPNELVLAPDATIEDLFGNKHPLDRAGLVQRLAACELGTDGQLRGLASRFLEGKLLGGHPGEGRRADDPNDRIPHERRRDLRGAYSLFAWLDHVDVKENNTLDVWVEDPSNGRHYVKHYLLDFGKSLGVMATMGRDLRRGYTYKLDFGEIARALATAGLVERPWAERRAPIIRGVGVLEARTYVPAGWKADSPGYVPFLVADARDKLWGAKLVMRFTRAQLAAAIEAARYTDPRAATYVLETLIERQRATARHWFAQASPLDRFAIDGERLAFDDLMLAYELAPAVDTTYLVERFDSSGRPIASKFELRPGPGGRVTMPLGLARDGDGYTIFEIATRRDARALAIYVHVARDATGAPRVIGVWRP
jgi:hypothetical protein